MSGDVDTEVEQTKYRFSTTFLTELGDSDGDNGVYLKRTLDQRPDLRTAIGRMLEWTSDPNVTANVDPDGNGKFKLVRDGDHNIPKGIRQYFDGPVVSQGSNGDHVAKNWHENSFIAWVAEGAEDEYKTGTDLDKRLLNVGADPSNEDQVTNYLDRSVNLLTILMANGDKTGKKTNPVRTSIMRVFGAKYEDYLASYGQQDDRSESNSAQFQKAPRLASVINTADRESFITSGISATDMDSIAAAITARNESAKSLMFTSMGVLGKIVPYADKLGALSNGVNFTYDTGQYLGDNGKPLPSTNVSTQMSRIDEVIYPRTRVLREIPNLRGMFEKEKPGQSIIPRVPNSRIFDSSGKLKSDAEIEKDVPSAVEREIIYATLFEMACYDYPVRTPDMVPTTGGG